MQSGQTKYGIGMTVSACLWLGLFPLLQNGTYATLTRDKWTYMLLLAGVTVLCFLADLISRRVSRPRLYPLLTAAALILWMTVSSLSSPYPGERWWIGAGRREGLATQLCYFGLFFLFCFSRVNRKPVIYAAGAGVTAFLAVALLQRAGGNPLGLYPAGHSYETTPLFQSTIGHVDMGAGYLLILCGLFLPGFTESVCGGKRAVLTVALPSAVFLAICVWLIVTMDVQLGLLTLAVLLVWTLVRFLPAKFRLPVLILLVVLVLVLVWALPFADGALYELHEVLHGHLDPMFGSGRIGVWKYSLLLLKEGDHLWLGTGADSFSLRFNQFLGQYYKDHPEAERLLEYFDNPHNEYLAMALNCGIPALLLFLILIVGGCFGRSPWRDSVLAYAVQALLSFSVCLVAPMFWVVHGMSWSMYEKKDGAS